MRTQHSWLSLSPEQTIERGRLIAKSLRAGSVVALPEHYFDGGFIYLAHKNVQYDIRAGVGLNDPADDFFAGLGAVLRF